MIPAQEALERLREGNQRFASGTRRLDVLLDHSRRIELAEKQEPFAIVLGCSDSRVPTEIVFDQSLGDLFVIRVAGNIVAPSQLSSVEFAAARFGTRLVVVLGHSRCGAVQATLEELQLPPASRTKNLDSLIQRVRPSVAELLSAEPPRSIETLMPLAVRANVEVAVRNLQDGSDILEQLIRDNGLLVVGAEYSLETGVVEFFNVDNTG